MLLPLTWQRGLLAHDIILPHAVWARLKCRIQVSSGASFQHGGRRESEAEFWDNIWLNSASVAREQAAAVASS